MSGAGAPPDDLRYPIGKLRLDREALSAERRAELIDRIRALPARLRAAVAELDARALDTPYRDGGWTPRQMAHHIADSHTNALVRFKLTLTEDDPVLGTYDEARWAELPDTLTLPVEPTLQLLEGLHERWTRLLDSLEPEQFRRPARHPEDGPVTLDILLQVYGWHGDHHSAHIERCARASQG